MRKYFEFYNPTKINCGKDALRTIGAELDYFGANAPMVLASTNATRMGSLEKVLAALKGSTISVGVAYNAMPSCLDLDLLRALKAKYAEGRCDSIIAIGGESTMDSAKALKLFLSENCDDFLPLAGVARQTIREIPLITVPTECGSGHEASGFIEVEENFISNPSIIPNVVVIDSEVAAIAPARVTAAGGIYILANAIEAYLAAEDISIIEVFAQKAVKLVFEHLERVVGGEESEDDCVGLSLASVFGGISYGNAPYGAAHAIAEALADATKEPIEEMVSAVLVATLKKLSEEKKEKLAELLPCMCSAEKLAEIPHSEWITRTIADIEDLLVRLHDKAGVPAKISDTKVQREIFGSVADTAQSKRAALTDMRPIGQEEFLKILAEAY